MLNRQKRTYYDTLDVEQSASKAEIKKKYRKIALENHPDKTTNPDATERMQAANEAYETLIDEDTRKTYDATLEAQTESEIENSQTQSPPDFFGYDSDFFNGSYMSHSFFGRPSYQQHKEEPREEPGTYAGFYQNAEDVFRPYSIRNSDFTSYVTKEPLDNILNYFLEYIRQIKDPASRKKEPIRLFNAFFDEDNEIQNSASTNDKYSCTKQTSEDPYGNQIIYILVQAPSSDEMAYLFQALYANAVVTELAFIRRDEHEIDETEKEESQNQNFYRAYF